MLIVTSNFHEYWQKQRGSVHVATDLYDLIETLSEKVPSNERETGYSGNAENSKGQWDRLLILNECN